jgi:phosphoglycerol transferase MdoB-like AlkP superfamily enzyme
MKKRVIVLVETYLLFVALFVLFKPLFMLYNLGLYHTATAGDWLRVMWHGLSMDFSVAGYVTAIPALLMVVSVFVRGSVTVVLHRIYYAVIAFFVPMILIVDMVLYSYWGFRLDSTPLFYFFTSPADAMASISIWFVVLGVIVWLALAFGLYLLLCRLFVKTLGTLTVAKGKEMAVQTVVMLLLTALLILPIRGGFTVSTMNKGRVYFSANQQLNHAALNPCFTLLSSYVGEMKTAGMYRFMRDEEANRIFSTLTDTSTDPQSTQVLNTARPNVIVVVLESFSCKIMATMGGVKNVAVNMDRLGQDGVLFTNFYANSWRTDRGLASILAAYPAQPTTSIMKYTDKCENLPMFPKVMKQAGYDLQYYYGGDVNFTGLKAFLVIAGFDKIVADKDFPIALRISKWGAPDGALFSKVLDDLRQPSKQPFLKVIETSSSHEPYDVPYHRLSDIRLNAFAYADSCLGSFVRSVQASPLWKNTLIVLVPDHLGVYPQLKDNDNYAYFRYHIPLIFCGGAVKRPMRVDTYGSQIDIAATLLRQLGLPHQSFTFSKDMFSAKAPHFAFATFPNALGLFDRDDSVFFDCESRRVINESGRLRGKNLPRGKAFLQKLYDDLGKRGR